jgi:signal transduction histidine kinase
LGRVRIRVCDTGIGMTPEESARVFREFARVKNEKTRSILGSGLGLSTVRKVAQIYSGEVTVMSAPDVGSTFEVVLTQGAVDVEPGRVTEAPQEGEPTR